MPVPYDGYPENWVETMVSGIPEDLRIQRVHVDIASLPHQSDGPFLVFHQQLGEALVTPFVMGFDRLMGFPIPEAVDVVFLVEVLDKLQFFEPDQLCNDVQHILFPDARESLRRT